MAISPIDGAPQSLPTSVAGKFALVRAPIIRGLTLVTCIAGLAHIAGRFTGAIPDVVLALVAGIVLNNSLRLDLAVRPGTDFVLRYVLRAAIIMLGAGLTLATVEKLGFATLVLVASCVLSAMILGVMFAKAGRVGNTIGTLIGVGTAICGGSAIIAIGPLIAATDAEIAYAVTTIFTFNIVALLIYPTIGHALHMSQVQFGSWAGTAVNDTSVVVATGYIFGHISGVTATAVKLTRTLLLVPLAVAIASMQAASGTKHGGGMLTAGELTMTFPWFVLFFAAMVVLNSVHVIPPSVATALTQAAAFLIVMALAAIGLNVDLKRIYSMGFKPLIVGFGLATTMAIVSFGITRLLRIG